VRITDVPMAVLRFQYQIARLPLQLIEDQVVARMDAEASARLFYERSLGMLDATVGGALGAPELQKRGAALVERSDALRRAAQLDAVATQNVKQAGADLKRTRNQATEEQKEAHAEKEQEVKQARSEALERKRAATETAQKRTASAKRKADEVADQRTNAAEAAKREQEAMIRAAERNETATAQAKLEDAQDKRVDAATKRAQADKVEEFADAEKQKRQSERADN
jgi:hypothetical protein